MRTQTNVETSKTTTSHKARGPAGSHVRRHSVGSVRWPALPRSPAADALCEHALRTALRGLPPGHER
eukprot:4517013-Prymnesium_polylepis.2